MEVSSELHAPDPGAHWIGGCVGARGGLDAVEYVNSSCPCQDLNAGLLTYSPLPYRFSLYLRISIDKRTNIGVHLFIYQYIHLLSFDMPALMKTFVTLNLTSVPALLFIGKSLSEFNCSVPRCMRLVLFNYKQRRVGRYKNHFTKLLQQFNA
jgi:hypothetical protein